MILKKNVLAGAGLLLLITAGHATAQVHIGDPIIIEGGPQSVSVHYFYATTNMDGVLWLDGSSTHDGQDVPLFFNHSGELGFEHILGRYEEGDRLDFIYDVLTGEPDSFRTTDPIESLQFRWEWTTPDIIEVDIDDMRLPAGDADYNDMVFEVRMHAIPAPGPTAGLALLPLLGLRRRR
jgi:hypothetical protein